MLLEAPRPVAEAPMVLAEIDAPRPAPDEILIAVAACGVCRTDLHVVEGELPLPVLPVVPGHQAIGQVLSVGDGVSRFRQGDRVGVAWVSRFCGQCGYCVEGHENLCVSPQFTGYHRNGGFAERIVAPAAYCHAIPDHLGDDVHAAPLLCAGIIGYRALKRSALRPGSRIALYGFGAAAHIAIQIARSWGCEVFVVTRSEHARRKALEMGASWVGEMGEAPPRRVHSAVTFAPAGSVLPEALSSLRRGGTLAVAGIYLDGVPRLDYDEHLFHERNLVTVTANTRADALELLDLAGRLGIDTDVRAFELEEANDALLRLKTDNLGAQAGVLVVRG